MKIKKEKIKKLATLAALKLPDDQLQKLSADFVQITDFIDILEEVDVSNLSPLTHIHEINTILREDRVNQEDLKDSALKNAKHHDSDYFKVPKVINLKK